MCARSALLLFAGFVAQARACCHALQLVCVMPAVNQSCTSAEQSTLSMCTHRAHVPGCRARCRALSSPTHQRSRPDPAVRCRTPHSTGGTTCPGWARNQRQSGGAGWRIGSHPAGTDGAVAPGSVERAAGVVDRAGLWLHGAVGGAACAWRAGSMPACCTCGEARAMESKL